MQTCNRRRRTRIPVPKTACSHAVYRIMYYCVLRCVDLLYLLLVCKLGLVFSRTEVLGATHA
jgi:hypothetical protein